MSSVEILNRDLSHYEEAVSLATYGEHHRVRVGCVAAKSTSRIAGAFNTQRNSPFSAGFEFTTYHAEINVLRMLRRFDKVTLYIARIDKDGNQRPSRPCKNCMLSLKELGIKEIVYMNARERIVKEFTG